MPLELGSPIEECPGIGPARARGLRRLGIEVVEDLLWQLPFRFEDRSRQRSIAELEEGAPAVIRVEVVRVQAASVRRRRMSVIEARVQDATGNLRVVFFNQPWIQDRLKPGREVRLYGTPARRNLFLELVNPIVEEGGEPDAASTELGRIVPVYRKLGDLTSRAQRRVVQDLLRRLAGRIPEILPAGMIREESLVPRERALREAHYPAGEEEPEADPRRAPAYRRLAFEELFVEQLGLVARHRQAAARRSGIAIEVDPELRTRLVGALPYRLTGAQRRVLTEIARDLAGPAPMHRLLQGDVGAGKTAVAALAMGMAAGRGFQSALMAPTELLAEQHFRTLRALLEPAGFSTVLLTGSLSRPERRSILQRIAGGTVSIVVGTHALIQSEVAFSSLALAVVDEQHRFGVAQREGLGAKGTEPHVLVMTATPIPRSLALTVYGDLDLSVLDERPPGRQPVRTVVKTAPNEAETYGFVRRELERGRQAFIVCPLVEESEKSDLNAAEEWAEIVAGRYLRGFSVGLVHGRMKADERSRLMSSFAAGDLQAIVGTTVLEVGVDVPNVSVMVIEHADRFGLSQLHQLRGRIGRGSHASTCILMVRARVTEMARERLELVRSTTDGFRIAEADLTMRGPGELFGTRQWGMPSHRVANVLRDFQLLERAREWARRLSGEPGFLEGPLGQSLLEQFERRYQRGLVG